MGRGVLCACRREGLEPRRLHCWVLETEGHDRPERSPCVAPLLPERCRNSGPLDNLCCMSDGAEGAGHTHPNLPDALRADGSIDRPLS